MPQLTQSSECSRDVALHVRGHEKQEWQDPFDPHEEALFVHNLGPGHKLLLNKFNVVAHHCLVVTKSGLCALAHCFACRSAAVMPMPTWHAFLACAVIFNIRQSE